MIAIEQPYEKLLQAEEDDNEEPADATEVEPEKVEKEVLEDGTVINVIKAYKKPQPFHVSQPKAPGAWAKRARKFSEILRFIEVNQRRRSKRYCTVIPIPIDSKEYLRIWGNRQNVHRTCIRMQELGLIEKFKGHEKKKHLASLYKYYYENEKLFFEYCRKHGIAPGAYEDRFDVQLSESIKSLPLFDSKKIRFDYKLDMEVPNDIDRQSFQYNFVRPSLYENYPGYLMWKQKIEDEINPVLEKEDSYLKLTFEPHLTWGAVHYKKGGKTKTLLRKIGIRLANKLVGLSKRKGKNAAKSMACTLRKT